MTAIIKSPQGHGEVYGCHNVTEAVMAMDITVSHEYRGSALAMIGQETYRRWCRKDRLHHALASPREPTRLCKKGRKEYFAGGLIYSTLMGFASILQCLPFSKHYGQRDKCYNFVTFCHPVL
jgi:hypothetical protein